MPVKLGATVDGSEIPNNHLKCMKPVVNSGKFTISTGCLGFLNHQQYVLSISKSCSLGPSLNLYFTVTGLEFPTNSTRLSSEFFVLDHVLSRHHPLFQKKAVGRGYQFHTGVLMTTCDCFPGHTVSL